MKCFNLKYTSVFQQVMENKEIFTLLLLKEHSLHKYLLIFFMFIQFICERIVVYIISKKFQ